MVGAPSAVVGVNNVGRLPINIFDSSFTGKAGKASAPCSFSIWYDAV